MGKGMGGKVGDAGGGVCVDMWVWVEWKLSVDSAGDGFSDRLPKAVMNSSSS
jgi:hypothetical protein